MTSYQFGLSKRKSKKKQLSDYNFYLKEASSSDSVGTESVVSSCYDDEKLDETFLDDSDEDDAFVMEADNIPLTTTNGDDISDGKGKSLSSKKQQQQQQKLDKDATNGLTGSNSPTDVKQTELYYRSLDKNKELTSRRTTTTTMMSHTTTDPKKEEHCTITTESVPSENYSIHMKPEQKGEKQNTEQVSLNKIKLVEDNKTTTIKGKMEEKEKEKEEEVEYENVKKGKDMNNRKCENDSRNDENEAIEGVNNPSSTAQVFFNDEQRTRSNTVLLLTQSALQMQKNNTDDQNTMAASGGLNPLQDDVNNVTNCVSGAGVNQPLNNNNTRNVEISTGVEISTTIASIKKIETQQEIPTMLNVEILKQSSTTTTPANIDGSWNNSIASLERKDTTRGKLMLQQQQQQQQQPSYPIRADQFNKVCPLSPFDDVPGFRRSFSTQHHQSSSKRDKELILQTSPKLSKSSSMDTPQMLHSPVVVGRDKWIRFEELNRSHDMKPDDSAAPDNQTANGNITNGGTVNCSTPSSSTGKKDWISFEGGQEATPNDAIILKMSQQNETLNSPTVHNENIYDEDDNEHNEEERIILSTQEKCETEQEGGGKLRKDKALLSTENLLDVVNKTVSLLRGSITNRGDEEKGLVSVEKSDGSEGDYACSELSDEVISLEFDTDEEKLRDTPIKQFTDVSLFQATTAKTDNPKPNLDDNNKDINSIDDIDYDDLLNESVDQYPPEISRTTWNFWYRYPDKKRKFSSRKWLPISVSIEGDFLKIESSSKSSSGVVREIPLHPFYVFTVPVLHKGNKDGKVHSVKLQYVKYKEKRRLKARFGVEHIPIYTPVVKLSSRDVIGLREFIGQVESIIRHIPTYRDKGITYTHEEIFIDSEDQCQYLISGDGKILKYNVTVQLRLRVFVTGNPELKLFLNDVNNKEILSRTKEALLQDDRKPSNNWISPECYEYHPCVDANKSNEEGGVVFIPPDGCSFELLRFRIRKHNPLPLVAMTSLEVLALTSVHLKAEVRVNSHAKSIRHKRTNVVLYIPVPSSWSKLFLKSRSFGKTKNYISVKTNMKLPRSAKASNSRVTLSVSIGNATYEPAYGSIVWKIGTLPIIRDGVPADAPHTFECFIELPFPLHIRDEFQPNSYLEYNIAHQMGSEVSVEEVLLSDDRVPEKWVCYRSSYMHTMQMKIMEDGKETKCSS